MRKSLITLLVISFLTTPCFAAGINPGRNVPHKKPPIVQRVSHRIPIARRHHMPIVQSTAIIVDYNCAGAPTRVTKIRQPRLLNQRFDL